MLPALEVRSDEEPHQRGFDLDRFGGVRRLHSDLNLHSCKVWIRRLETSNIPEVLKLSCRVPDQFFPSMSSEPRSRFDPMKISAMAI